MNTELDQFRLLPSVDELLQAPQGQLLVSRYSHTLAVRSLRVILAQARAAIRDGANCPSYDELLALAGEALAREQQPSLRPVINATGVIINTNLGRAPLSAERS